MEKAIVKRDAFINWIIGDKEDLNSYQGMIIDSVLKDEIIDAKSFFEMCDYIPASLCLDYEINSEKEFLPNIDCFLETKEEYDKRTGPDYKGGYNVLIQYWDSLPDEEKDNINEELKQFNL